MDGWKQIPLSHSSPHIDEKDMKGYEVRAANPLRFSRHGHVSFPLSLSLSLSLSLISEQSDQVRDRVGQVMAC